ncbi:MAG TPA: replication initiator protein A [Verrucomicrobiae bacterium]|nr:replication initiator protein A [Verrucomicrobiae bacterium]
MKANTRIEDDAMPQKNGEAKDEMNLAEFPLCALSHRLKPEVKTLRFEDRIHDKSTGNTITRQLTITGSDAYGLPTEKDDEVLLGLIQLTRLRGFADRKVFFTRHELIRMLGWRDDSKSYARVEASLNRWTGVTLFHAPDFWCATSLSQAQERADLTFASR